MSPHEVAREDAWLNVGGFFHPLPKASPRTMDAGENGEKVFEKLREIMSTAARDLLAAAIRIPADQRYRVWKYTSKERDYAADPKVNSVPSLVYGGFWYPGQGWKRADSSDWSLDKKRAIFNSR